jgi:hypothetical protein
MAEENKNKKLEDLFGASSRTNKEKLQSIDNTAKAIAHGLKDQFNGIQTAMDSQVKKTEKTADVIVEASKSNKLKAKEDKNEMQLFFKNLIGEFKSTFKDAKDAVVKPIKDKSIFGIGKMILAAIPAIGAGLVAGFLGPIVGIFKKIPFIGKALKAFKGVIGFFAKVLSPILKIFKPVITLVSKVVNPFVKVFKWLAKGLSPLLGLFKGGGGIFKVFFKFGKVLGKLVWPITALIAIVEGAIAAVKEWQSGGSIVDIIGKFFAGIVSSLTFGLYDSDQSIGENFRGLIVWIGELFGHIGDWIRGVGPTVLGWIDMGIMWFKNLLDEIVFFVQYDLPGVIRTAWDNILWFFTTGLPDMIVNLFYKLKDFFTGDGFTNMISAIWDFLKEIPTMFIDVWSSVLGFIRGFVKGIGRATWGVLADIIGWLAVKILDIQASLMEWLNDKVDWLVDDDLVKGMRQAADAAHELNETRKAKNEALAEEERKLAKEEMERKQAERERIRKEKKERLNATRDLEIARRSGKSGVELQTAQTNLDTPLPSGVAPVKNTNVNTVISNKNESIYTGGMTVRDNNGPQFIPV